MFTLTLLFLVAMLSVAYLFLDYRRRAGNKRSPPGPLGWPVVGYFPFLGELPHETFTKLGEKYGKIFRLTVGSQNVVVLNDYDIIKEAFVKHGHQFEARANAFHDTYYLFDNVGIFLGSVESVRELRRLITSTLKDFGASKVTCEDLIYKECEVAISKVKSLKGVPFDPMRLFGLILGNIMTRFIWSESYQYDDPRFQKLLQLSQHVDEVIGKMDAIDFMPWLRFLPEKIRGFNFVRETRKNLEAFMDEIVDEHKRTFNEKRIRDFVDIYLNRMRSQKIDESTNIEKYSFMIRQLRSFLIETFAGGAGSGSISLSLMIKVFIMKPEIQNKVLEELDRVIGQDRSPSYADRGNMPYTEAMTFEALRYANITPLGTYKSNAEPVTIAGYEIPPKSLVFANIGRQHFNPDFFAKPDEFDPVHCLDSDGKAIRPEHSMPFGIGRRLCPGQNFAEMQLFLIITCLLQKFTFHPPPSAKKEAESSSGLRTTVIYLKPFDICVKNRK